LTHRYFFQKKGQLYFWQGASSKTNWNMQTGIVCSQKFNPLYWEKTSLYYKQVYSVSGLKIAFTKRTSNEAWRHPLDSYKKWGYATDYGHSMKAYIKDIWKSGPMWKTKYASAVPKNLRLGLNFRPCSAGIFFSGRP
jgi:hypothetical protein